MLWYPTGGGDEFAILKTAALEPASLKCSCHLLISEILHTAHHPQHLTLLDLDEPS
jgi:hypothetical protein